MSRKGRPLTSGSKTTTLRAVWVVTTCAVFLAQVPALRASFTRVRYACAEPNCNTGQLTVQAMQALHAAGLSLDAFALWDDMLLLIAMAVFCIVGGLIIWRRGSDRMGILAGFTLLLFGGATFPLGTPMEVLHLEGPLWGPAVNVLCLAGSVGIGLFLYLFPDGRFVPRWIAVVAAVWVFIEVASYLAPGSAFDSQDGSASSSLIAGMFWFILLLSMVGTQIYRYRAVSGVTERQQTKWVVLGVVGAIIGFLVMIVVGASVALVYNTGPVFLVYQAVFRFLMLPIPIGIGFAMLRYRLWDVDVLINRALVYGSLTLSTGALYFAGVLGLEAILRVVVGETSNVAVAIVTLAVAALFNPWRHRLQSFIDRRFYRRRYDATRTLATFSNRLRNEVDLDQLTNDLLVTAHETMQPAAVALWLPEGCE